MHPLVTIGLTNALVIVPLAALVFLLSRLLKRPALTHALWMLLLLKLVTPPVFNIPVALPVHEEPATIRASAPGSTVMMRDPTPRSTEPGAKGAEPGRPSGLGVSPSGVATPPPEPAAEPPTATAPFLTVRNAVPVVWILGAGILVLIGASRVYSFNRLLRHATPAPPDIDDIAARVAARLGLAHCPPVEVLAARVSPMLWGVGSRLRLIIPQSLWEDLSPPQREGLLAHELAHVRRGDPWARILELLVACIYWWHPVVWLIRREAQECAEQCCDGWAVWVAPHRARAYAQGLLQTVDFVSEEPVPLPPARCGMGEVGHIKRRIEMIVTGQTSRTLSASSRILVCTIGLIGLLAMPGIAADSGAAPDAAPKGSPRPGAVDRHGDALPLGSVVLLGTVRLRHCGHVYFIAFSPDGRRLATGDWWASQGKCANLRIWDVATGRQELEILHSGGGRSVDFSADGRVLASGGYSARLFDAETGEEIRSIECEGEVPDIRRLWATGEEFDVTWTEPGGPVQFAAGGRMLVTSGRDRQDTRTIANGVPLDTRVVKGAGYALLWDPQTGRETQRIPYPPGPSFDASAVAKDGSMLAFSAGREVTIRELPSGREIGRVETRDCNRTLLFTPDARQLVMGASPRNPDGTWRGVLRFVDTATWKVTATVPVAGGQNSLAVSEDGDFLALGGIDGKVRILDMRSKDVVLSLENGSIGVAVAFSPDGKFFAAENDHEVRLWRLERGADGKESTLTANEQFGARKSHAKGIHLVALSGDEDRVATSGHQGDVCIWDRASGKPIARHSLDGFRKRIGEGWVEIRDLVFDDHGNLSAIAATPGALRRVDIATGRERPLPRLLRETRFNRFVYSLDRGTLATETADVVEKPVGGTDSFQVAEITTTSDVTITTWDVSSGKKLFAFSIERNQTTPLYRVSAVASGGRLVATNGFTQMAVWDASTGKTLFSTGLAVRGPSFYSYAFSPDAKWLAVGKDDGSIDLWEVARGRVAGVLRGHSAMVHDLVFTRDGRFLVSGSDDCVALVWDLERAGFGPGN